MLSRASMGAWHPGQLDGGLTTERPSGTRYATTLRNDPIARPKAAMRIEAPSANSMAVIVLHPSS